MKATGICVILLSQDGFKSDCPGKMKNESTQKLFYFFLFFGIRNLESRKKIVEIEFYLFIYLFIFVLRHYILGKKVRKSKNKKKLNRINLQNLKWSSDRLAIIAKRFLKLPNLHMLIKQKSQWLPRNLALWTFGGLLIVFSTKINLLYLLSSLFSGPELLSSASGEANLFAKNFSKNSNLDDIGIFVPAFPSRTSPNSIFL